MDVGKQGIQVRALNAGAALVGENNFYGPVQFSGIGGLAAKPVRSNFGDANVISNPLFRGRADQLAQLRNHFDSRGRGGKTRAHKVVVGEGGMGKSQLVQRYAEEDSAAWDGQWWIDGSPELHASAIRRLAKLVNPNTSDTASPSECRTIFRNALGSGRHLVIVDAYAAENPESPNYELLDELDPGGESCLLITTRDQNTPRRFGSRLQIPVLSEADAVALLRRDTPRLQSGEEGDTDKGNCAELALLARHLSFHPLAVDLAGAWLQLNKGLRISDLLDGLKKSDSATLALFDRPELRGHAHRYTKGVIAALSLHMDHIPSEEAHIVLDYLAYCAPDRIRVEVIARATGLNIEVVQDNLRALAGTSVLCYLEGGEHGVVRVNALMQMVIRELLPNKSCALVHGTSSRLQKYLLAMAGEFGDFTDPSLQLRNELLPHAHNVVNHAARVAPLELGYEISCVRAGCAAHRALLGELATSAADIDACVAWYQANRSKADEHFYMTCLSTRASIRQARGEVADAEHDIDECVKWAECQNPVPVGNLAWYCCLRAVIRSDAENHEGAISDINRSIHLEEAKAEPDPRARAIWYATRAQSRLASGDFVGAEADVEVALEWQDANPKLDGRGRVVCLRTRAGCYAARKEFAPALSDIDACISWLGSQSPRDERVYAICVGVRASILLDSGQLEEAETGLKASIDWYLQHPQRYLSELAGKYHAYAQFQNSGGSHLAGEANLTNAIKIRESQPNRNGEALARLYEHRGHVRRKLGNAEGARSDFNACIDWWESHPCDQKYLAFDYLARHDLRKQAGDWPGALQDIDKAIAIQLKMDCGDDGEELSVSRLKRAETYAHLGDLRRSEESTSASIAWLESHSIEGMRALCLAYALSERAKIRCVRLNLAGGEDDARKAILITEPLGERYPEMLALHYRLRAEIRCVRKFLSGAATDAGKALALCRKCEDAIAVVNCAILRGRIWSWQGRRDAAKSDEILAREWLSRTRPQDWKATEVPSVEQLSAVLDSNLFQSRVMTSYCSPPDLLVFQSMASGGDGCAVSAHFAQGV